MPSEGAAWMSNDQKFQLALIIIGCVGFVALAATIALAWMGIVAFRSGEARVFGLFFQELPAVATVVFIVMSAVGLTAFGWIGPEACVTLFGSIAGYVLGERMHRRERGTPETRSDKSGT
jgi:hypothetical protein